jgi:hypothetical protein
MPGFWTPRNEIYGARPYWFDDPLLAETFTQAEIKALENAKTHSDAPQTWASGPCPGVCKGSKRWASNSLHLTRSPRCSGSQLRGSLAITTTGLPPVSHRNFSRRTKRRLGISSPSGEQARSGGVPGDRRARFSECATQPRASTGEARRSHTTYPTAARLSPECCSARSPNHEAPLRRVYDPGDAQHLRAIAQIGRVEPRWLGKRISGQEKPASAPL